MNKTIPVGRKHLQDSDNFGKFFFIFWIGFFFFSSWIEFTPQLLVSSVVTPEVRDKQTGCVGGSLPLTTRCRLKYTWGMQRTASGGESSSFDIVVDRVMESKALKVSPHTEQLRKSSESVTEFLTEWTMFHRKDSSWVHHYQ